MCVKPDPSPEGQSEVERELKISRRAHLLAVSQRDYYKTLWSATFTEVNALRTQVERLTKLSNE